jgi:predicted transcriptional regulator
MNMISDLYKDIKIQLYERATSPLLGSFVISWCLWNYKLLLVIVSSGNALEKIAYINGVLYPDYQSFGLYGILGPLLTTLFFIYLYPIPARYVFKYTREQQAKTKVIQQQIEDNTPLTQKESREIRASMRILERAWDTENAEYMEKIDGLKTDLRNAEQRAINTRAKLDGAEAELSRWHSLPEKYDQKKPTRPAGQIKHDELKAEWSDVLWKLADLSEVKKDDYLSIMANIFSALSSGRSRIEAIAKTANKEQTIVHYNLDLLKGNKYVELSNNGFYDLTEFGRKFYVERMQG